MVLGSKVTMVAVTTLWKVSATTSKVARSHPGASARELLARATAPWALIVKLPEESIFIQFTPVCMKIWNMSVVCNLYTSALANKQDNFNSQ